MPTSASDVINDLISTCRDSQEGYGKAAKGVHNDSLRRLLVDIYEERERFVQQLQGFPGAVADRPHGGGPLHRGWSELEARIRPKSDAELIANCLEGDTNTVAHYEHAIASGLLTAEAREMVQNQLARVRVNLDQLRSRQSE